MVGSAESASPNDIELLIRSTSTILSFVNPQQDSEIPHGEKSERSMSRQLDRIALLFITENSGDVAAVAASMTPSGIEVVATATEADVPAHERELALIESFNVAKNSETNRYIYLRSLALTTPHLRT